MKVFLFWQNFGPYHCARVDAASEVFRRNGGLLTPVEVAGRDADRLWMSDEEKARLGVETLFSGRDYRQIRPREARGAILSFLRQHDPDCIVILGYAAPECRAALSWALRYNRPVVLMSDTQYGDSRGPLLKQSFKRLIVRKFDAALAGGGPQSRYLVGLGIPRERVFVGYDVVDNDLFRLEAQKVRSNGAQLRQGMSLPQDYFLSVCRFDPVKNLPRLLIAYAAYRRRSKSRAWGLVLCGSGQQEGKIRQVIETLQLQNVVLPGFIQVEQLPVYYALASCYVAPSTKDTWNLSVNEAMASGLPVLVSTACGCAEDLVRNGVNGYTFDPYDTQQLAELMLRMSSGSVNLKAMGEASRAIISKWSPQTFAENLWRAVETAVEYHASRRPSVIRQVMRWF